MSSSPPGGPSSAAATTGTPAGTATGNPAGSADVAGHPAVVRVRAALVAAGADGDGVVVLDDHARTAAAAAERAAGGVAPAPDDQARRAAAPAERLGARVGQIATSLVFAAPDAWVPGGRRPLLVLTSGSHRVDTAKVARLVGTSRLDRADA